MGNTPNILLDSKKLKPCPFCGNHYDVNSYDRGINFKCETCNYTRCFDGLLSMKKNDKPISYNRTIIKGRLFWKKEIIEKVPINEVKHQEYYNNKAYSEALLIMNRRS